MSNDLSRRPPAIKRDFNSILFPFAISRLITHVGTSTETGSNFEENVKDTSAQESNGDEVAILSAFINFTYFVAT